MTNHYPEFGDLDGPLDTPDVVIVGGCNRLIEFVIVVGAGLVASVCVGGAIGLWLLMALVAR